MIPYPLRPVKKFPQKINLALPKPPKKQISLHRGEKSAVFSRELAGGKRVTAGEVFFSHERWAGAAGAQPKPAKTYDMRRAASGVGRPGKPFLCERRAARRVMVDGGRGGVAATKKCKNLRHAVGGAAGGVRWPGKYFFRTNGGRGRRVVSGGRGSIFFARVGGRKRVTAGAMGGAASNGRRWAGRCGRNKKAGARLLEAP